MITFNVTVTFLLIPFMLALLYLHASLVCINHLTRYILYQRDYIDPTKDITTTTTDDPTNDNVDDFFVPNH